MTTNDILKGALYAMADAQERIAPGTGDGLKVWADEKYPQMKWFYCHGCESEFQAENIDVAECPECKEAS